MISRHRFSAIMKISVIAIVLVVATIFTLWGASSAGFLGSSHPGGPDCNIKITTFPSFQNDTPSVSDLQRLGLSSNSTTAMMVKNMDLPGVYYNITHSTTFLQRIKGFVWVSGGWGPYTSLNTNDSNWGTYFPYGYGSTQDSVTPKGVAFWFEVYGHDGTWYGGFLSAYSLQLSNVTFSPYQPHVECPILP